MFKTDDILGQSVDELVVKGIEHVSKQGENLDARAGSGIQAYNLNYILSNCRDRIHCLRNPQSVRYLSRELLLYFSGTLLAEEMAKASTFWLRLQDNDGHINSNYGYYVFHQKTPGDLSQYEWCVRLLLERPETRRAMININSIIHKTDTKDMPCNMGLQFFIQSGMLCCVAYTRSTDVITGLPYDMGFFSLLTELIWKDLSERGMTGVKLGYCMMKTCFSQLYYDKNELVETVLEKADQPTPQIMMPEINSAKMLLEDIYNKTSSSDVMQWCHTHARTR
ncbi:MAG TPA: thymidylate synthase [Candidatus Saccharimonadales bacterium]|nr:thymidylate synthase [Candidatus Saccharimonadales bacterium]